MERSRQGEEEFVNANPEVEIWIEARKKRSEATANYYSNQFFIYWRWLTKEKGFQTTKELLDDFKEKKKTEQEYDHIDWLKEFLFTPHMIPLSNSHKGGIVAALRAFYRFHRCALPREKIDFKVTEVDEAKAREKLAKKPMTIDDIGQLISPLKIREKSAVLILLQSGMGIGEFTKTFNVCNCRKEWLESGNKHVCEPAKVMTQLREGKHPVKIEFVRRKLNEEKYYTFIGKDATEALKQYLVFRRDMIGRKVNRLRELEQKEKSGKKLQKWEVKSLRTLRKQLENLTPEWQPTQPIFVTNYLEPIHDHNIRDAVKTAQKQMGLTDREFRIHMFRDIFKTECSHAGVKDEISEFFTGHALDKYGYNRLHEMHPEDIVAEYSRVEPYLNIVSGGAVNAKEVEELKRSTEKLRKGAEDKDDIIRALVENGRLKEEKLRRLEDEFKSLRSDFDKMMAYMTEEGKKRIFGDQ